MTSDRESLCPDCGGDAGGGYRVAAQRCCRDCCERRAARDQWDVYRNFTPQQTVRRRQFDRPSRRALPTGS